MKYSVIVPAAGQGVRMGLSRPKTFLPLGFPCDTVVRHPSVPSLLTKTISTFDDDERCEKIVVCVSEEWRDEAERQLAWCNKRVVVLGGETRQESVARGLEALDAAPDNRVLVHDAARCCVSLALVTRVLEGIEEWRAVTAAVPAFDALVKSEAGEISESIDRKAIWSVQTPQGFRLGDLREAHRLAGVQRIQALDDASLVARLVRVHLVPGDRLNIKVTTQEDLSLVERLIAKGVC